MIKGFYENKGTNLYYEIQGEGETIVFLHGFSLDHTMWDDQVSFFSQKYQVLTYDMRGFGKSSMPTNSYSHYEDLYELLAFLNIKKVHIVGLSMGGESAVDFAISYPAKVLSLTVLDASFGGYPYNEDWNVYADQVGLVGAKQNWLNHSVFEATRKNDSASNSLKRIVGNYSGWHWINKDPRKRLSGPTAMERLSEIKIPTLIIVGEEDLKYFRDQAGYMHSTISNSTLITIPNAGHMTNLEAPENVNELISEFLVQSAS